MDNIIRIYCIGIFVLLIAILANVIVSRFGIATWYDFGPKFFSKGFNAVINLGALNIVWLFIIYPLTLGFGYVIGDYVYKLCIR